MKKKLRICDEDEEFTPITDMSEFIKLYARFGIDLVFERFNSNYIIKIRPGVTNKFMGFTGLYTVVIFDEKEKFIGQALYDMGHEL